MQQSGMGWRYWAQSLGPGILMATAAIGGSHLVASTQAGALFGWQLLWLILLVNILKYPFFRFGVQYTLQQNESLVEGYWRKGRGYFYSFVLLNVLAAVVNTAGVLILTAALLQYALPWQLSLTLLCWLILASCLLILLLGHYRALDRVSKVIMLLLTLTTLVAAAIAFNNGPTAPAGFQGPSPWQLAMLGFLVALMGWMPAPIEISAISSLWLKAKQRQQPVSQQQGLFDFNLGYWLTTFLALVFVTLGALVQYGSDQPIALAGAAFAQQLVEMYGQTIGSWAKPLVSLIAFLCMFGTTITVLDGYARTLHESGRLLGWYQADSRRIAALWLLLQALAGMALILFFRSALSPMLTFAMTLAFLTTPVFAWLNFSLLRSNRKQPLPLWLNVLSWVGLAWAICLVLPCYIWPGIWESLMPDIAVLAWWQSAGLFLLQLVLILLAAQLFGRLARYIGQPKVVGEMIAGIALGPSLLGWWQPELQQAIFIPETRSWLYFGAQLGVGLYMFLVGLEFNTRLFRQQAQSALAVSLAGMLVPFAVAALLVLWLLPMPGLFAPGISYPNAALFLGAAIAITAFPMLARIIYERGLAGTKLGTLALAAGAIDDAAAWLVLALVLASFGGGSELLIKALLGGSLYAWLMLTKMRLWLQPLADRVALTEQLAAWQFMLILLLFALSAWSMDFVGLHAVFGGFLLGIAMPRGTLVSLLQRRLEKPVLLLLLPMFFTYSGLNTRLDVLGAGGLWLVTLAVLACSILAKFVACWAAARLKGADNPTALAIGALMNARGLMELIIINIALSYGVIEQGLFSMLVVMAIVTTLMAAPLFQLVYGRHQQEKRA